MSYFGQILEATPHETTAVQLLTSHFKNIKVRWTKHARHYWRIKEELITDVVLWILTHGHMPVLVDLQEPIYISAVLSIDVVWKTCWGQWMIDRWIKRIRKIHAVSATWWWIGTIQQLQMLLLMLWRLQTTVVSEILSFSYTLWVLFTRFAFMAWITALEFSVLSLPDHAWSSSFL